MEVKLSFGTTACIKYIAFTFSRTVLICCLQMAMCIQELRNTRDSFAAKTQAGNVLINCHLSAPCVEMFHKGSSCNKFFFFTFQHCGVPCILSSANMATCKSRFTGDCCSTWASWRGVR